MLAQRNLQNFAIVFKMSIVPITLNMTIAENNFNIANSEHLLSTYYVLGTVCQVAFVRPFNKSHLRM